MSSQKTPAYQLHSWLAGDDFLREEINENFTVLDRAVKGAENATAAAAAALNTEVGKKVELVAGAYAGDGAASRHFDLGFRPRAVILAHETNFYQVGVLAVDPNAYGGSFWMAIDDTGFTITYNTAYYTNAQSSNYVYVAFR